jgi:SAM-dependent methyltransferase
MVHYASYYRWLVASRYLRIDPRVTSALDVGCDDGFFLSQISLPFKVGVDLKPRPGTLTSFPILCADGSYLPFPDGSFDNVFAFDVIEHIEDDDTFLQSLVRVLAKRGHLWLSTPCASSTIFPSWLTAKAARAWGHVRNGYDVTELVGRFPQGLQVKAVLWDAQSFRLFYVLLRLISSLSPTLARWAAHACFWIDKRLVRGKTGYIFLEVTRALSAE